MMTLFKTMYRTVRVNNIIFFCQFSLTYHSFAAAFRATRKVLPKNSKRSRTRRTRSTITTFPGFNGKIGRLYFSVPVTTSFLNTCCENKKTYPTQTLECRGGFRLFTLEFTVTLCKDPMVRNEHHSLPTFRQPLHFVEIQQLSGCRICVRSFKIRLSWRVQL